MLASAAVCTAFSVFSWFAGPAIVTVPWTGVSAAVMVVLGVVYLLAPPLVILGTWVLIRLLSAMMFLRPGEN